MLTVVYQNPSYTPISPARREFLAFIYRACVEGCTPGCIVPLATVTSASELPLHQNIRGLLGKVYRYSGTGVDPMIDRIYIKSRIKTVIDAFGIFIKTLNIRLPSTLLQGGRKELVILSDTTAHGHTRSAQIVQAINSANFLMFAVDSKGLTNEMAALLVSSRFLEKLSNSDNVVFLDLSERLLTKKGHNITSVLNAAQIKELLIGQFKRLYRTSEVLSSNNVLNHIKVAPLRVCVFGVYVHMTNRDV